MLKKHAHKQKKTNLIFQVSQKMKYSPKFSESDLKQWQQQQAEIQEPQAVSQDFQETTPRHAILLNY